MMKDSSRQHLQALASLSGCPDWKERIVELERVELGTQRPSLDYNFQTNTLVGAEATEFSKVYAKAISVEKLAISTNAEAILRFCPSDGLTKALVRTIRDEGLHLQAITTLCGKAWDEEAWCAPIRVKFWDHLLGAKTLNAFLLSQHCLSETAGSLSAAEGLRTLRKFGRTSKSHLVASRILREEMQHALQGFAALAEIGFSRTEMEEVLDLYQTVEPTSLEAGFKRDRQLFAINLVKDFLESPDFRRTKRNLIRHVMGVLATGRVVSIKEELI